MLHFVPWLILCLAIAPIKANVPDECWETCVQQAYGTENMRFKELYDKVLEIALDVRALKDIYNVSHLTVAVDSALCNTPVSLFPAPLNTHNATLGFMIQQTLASIVMMIANAATNQVAHFNEEASWTCTGFNCINTCVAIKALTLNQNGPQTRPTSDCPGNVESACSLSGTYVNGASCGSTKTGTMLVAFTNGKLFVNGDDPENRLSKHDRKHCPTYFPVSHDDPFHEVSKCESLYSTRYVVATHSADKESNERLLSKHGRYMYVKDRFFALDGLTTLSNCFYSTCCSGTTAPTATSCQITSGPLGDAVNNWPQAPPLG